MILVYYRNRQKKSGYTLLELLLVIAILAIVMAVSMPFLFGHQQGIELEEEARRIAGSLRSAQNNAVSLENFSSWGVYFNATTSPYYELFWGPTYLEATTTDRFYLPDGIRFNTPAPGTTSTVIFRKRTGTVTGTTTVIIENFINSPPQQTTITVNPLGRIIIQ